MNNTKILITGCAGFIGFHLSKKIIYEFPNVKVTGIDSINAYYDVNLKYARLKQLGVEIDENKSKNDSDLYNNFCFIKHDLADFDFVVDLMINEKFDYVIHLAAQAGVRNSIKNPRDYTHANIEGFISILEGCRHSKVKHLIYASTSSVYGLNSTMPLSENQSTEHPMSLYSATKKANELMAHSYSHLYKIPTTGLRFFTVYGPWGRPDMALFLFTDAIIKNNPINIFNYGKMIRDFTYVEDITESIKRLIDKPAMENAEWNEYFPDPSSSSAPYQVFNIGNNKPTMLNDYITALEMALQKEAVKNYIEMQPGDVPSTHADTTKLEQYIGFKPATNVQDGVNEFVNWYLQFYKISNY